MTYPTDLNDKEWEIIRPFLEYSNGYGHKRKHSIREVINAIFYVVKTGCQCRFLPKDFPNWRATYVYFDRLNKSGKWEQVLTHINERKRTNYGKEVDTSFIIIDAQSVKTTSKGEKRGYDGGKKNQGTEKNSCS
jgi:putative transposase